jgi:hypothetical protein
MTNILANKLDDLSDLKIHAERAEIVTWHGRTALLLETGLALIPDLNLENASVDVLVGTEGPAYPGIVFRAGDILNFELAYAVPHVSGQWDTLQYDPVFHGSNTWQIYHGIPYQGVARVPNDHWFRLKVAFHGLRASISIDGQSTLTVERLAHELCSGLIGLWTYKPAYFCDLRVGNCDESDLPWGEAPLMSAGSVDAWFLEGYGVVACEPNGVLNLNRYLVTSKSAALLTRQFVLKEAAEVRFDFGYSDTLSLEIDGIPVYQGENMFQGFKDRVSRGYAAPGLYTLGRELDAGIHKLSAALETHEPFGWGFTLAAHGKGLSWLPGEWG